MSAETMAIGNAVAALAEQYAREHSYLHSTRVNPGRFDWRFNAAFDYSAGSVALAATAVDIDRREAYCVTDWFSPFGNDSNVRAALRGVVNSTINLLITRVSQACQ